MLTKQSRQFEQWAQDKENLTAIKARIAAEHQAKIKNRSALTLSFLGLGMSAYTISMWMITNDMDWMIVFVVVASAATFGLINVKP